MNEIDQQSKLFFDVNERFADFINGSLYQGRQVLTAQQLEEMDTEVSEKRRDMIKRSTKDGSVYALYGTEFQSTVDKGMPLRVMEYDLLTYQKMMKSKKRIYPVSTICLYTGKEKWKAARTLHQMMGIQEELKPFVQNYGVRIVSAQEVKVENFKNEEVREFFELFQDIHQLSKDEMYEKYSKKGLHSAEAVKTAAVLGKCKELEKMIVESEDGVKMCENFSRIVREWKDEGRQEGIQEGIAVGEARGESKGVFKEKVATIQRLCEMNMTIEMIAKITRLSDDEVMKIMMEHHMSYVH